MKRKKNFIRSVISLVVVTALSMSTISLAYYYPQMEEKRTEKEYVEAIEAEVVEPEVVEPEVVELEVVELEVVEPEVVKPEVVELEVSSGDKECMEVGCVHPVDAEGDEVDEYLAAMEEIALLGEGLDEEDGETLPVWITVLQRRDWMHSQGGGFNNLYPWNDNHSPRASFPVSPIIHDRDYITLGEMFNHFWYCPERRSNPVASHIKPGSEAEQRQAFRVWHATPGQRYHVDLVDGSSAHFPLSRWQTPHFQYAYVQYLHFNLNFCGNGLSSDVNHNFTRMNIMGSHYDRMFVFGGAGAGLEGHDSRYETLRNHLFPVSATCEVLQPHPSMHGVQPIYSHLTHPNGYIFGGWFKTLEQANNHESEEGRMFERTERVSTDLNRTLFARWIPVEVPCDDCGYDPCICEEVCDDCGEYPCVCEEVCDDCGEYPCVCEEVCDDCGEYPCVCEDVCDDCGEYPCVCEEVCDDCGEYPYVCEEVCDDCGEYPCVCEEVCDDCGEYPCVCEDVCDDCGEYPCVCEEVCDDYKNDPCTCDEVVCEDCNKNPCICEEKSCNDCDCTPCDCEEKECKECTCEEVSCEECNCVPCTCKECKNSETEGEGSNTNPSGGTNPSANNSNNDNNNNNNNTRAPQTGDHVQDLARLAGLLVLSLLVILGLIRIRKSDDDSSQ